ncbi:MAG: threonine--tRNA ligase [Candidatus Nanoarchaeia archaeon]|nr:threonine--tRNA ligase [Candidatus Nanoarchaeia archaeon]
MKILSLHCDYIKFKPLKKALKEPEELSEERKKEQVVKEPLVILTAVEKTDSLESVKELVKNIEDISSQVNDRKIVLYPYAHLSSNLGSPSLAIQILEEAEKELEKKKFDVVRAPFGYYKEFELKCKGHPLSELSREIGIKNGKLGTKEEKITDEMRKNLLNQISKSKLDTSKLKDNDHRILGQQMNLFSFNEVAPGMAFWHNNGLIIKNELINYWREMHRKNGYEEISTPQIMDSKLWKISGHWDLYKENNFVTEYEKRPFLVKPMNCPGGMLVYKTRPRSYKELPMRVGEIGVVHRTELSGTLAGLFRLIQFTQDDAHIFCTNEQLESEIIGVIELFRQMLDKFGFKYTFTLSTRSEEKKDKYLGSDKLWEQAEDALGNALKKLKIKFEKVPGEAKFYGPSLDVQIKDSQGREWQCSTLQLDFNIPARFELAYTGRDNKEYTPIMLHRVVYGAIERFIGVLLEHTNGRLPVWLAPVQVRVLSFTDRNIDYAKKVIMKLGEKIPNLRIDADFTQTTVQSKVKDAEIMRIPYIIVVGDKEEEEKTIAVRVKGNSKIQSLKIDNFIEKLSKEIRDRE